MAFTNSQAILLTMVFGLLAVSSANRGWPFSQRQLPKKIIVGGSEGWRFGFDYSDWALKTGPFFLHDTLVFKYDPPSNTTFPHNVYLLPDLSSFNNCDFQKAKLVANETQGGGEGFEFVLKKQKPYFFACGEHEGAHCKIGKMKFAFVPTVRN